MPAMHNREYKISKNLRPCSWSQIPLDGPDQTLSVGDKVCGLSGRVRSGPFGGIWHFDDAFIGRHARQRHDLIGCSETRTASARLVLNTNTKKSDVNRQINVSILSTNITLSLITFLFLSFYCDNILSVLLLCWASCMCVSCSLHLLLFLLYFVHD